MSSPSCHHCVPASTNTVSPLLWKSIIPGLVGFALMLSMLFGWLPAVVSTTGRWFWPLIAIIVSAVIIYSAGRIYSAAWRSLMKKNTNMDTLVAMGTGAAWIYSSIVSFAPTLFPQLAQHTYFEGACIIIALINLGSYLESRARQNTSDAIKKLMELQPTKATRVKNDLTETVNISDLNKDDIVRVKPGEKIAIDGIIIKGKAYIDESMLTGEPNPAHKNIDDNVTGGTLNTSGSFDFRVTKTGKETALAQIIKMVEHAQKSKPAVGRLADKVSSIFVPIVILTAIITAFIWFFYGPSPSSVYALVTSISVLLIACPCALGLATPIAIIAGTGKAANHHILIRNGDALQRCRKLDVIVLDKTGTITQGKPTMKSVMTETNQDELLQIAASVEQFSEHPIAHAIVQASNEKQLSLFDISQFQSIAGQGVEAKYKDQLIRIGKESYLTEAGITIPKTVLNHLNSTTDTNIFISSDKDYLGCISINDPIKDGAKNSIQQLQNIGLKVIMLTGDNINTANAIAKQINIDDVIANVLPNEKAEKIKSLQNKNLVVGMVGDGINDAPALAQADVGFAIGTGTDVAIESADITLMSGQLQGVTNAILISQSTMRTIYQNLTGAFGYNMLAIPIAAGALYPAFKLLLSPIIAGGAMALSSLTVVLNSNRLRRLRLKQPKTH